MTAKKKTTKTNKKKTTVPRVLGLYGGKNFRSEFTPAKQVPPLELKTKEGWYHLIAGGYTKENLNEWKAASIKWHGEAKFEVKEFKRGKTVLYGLYRLMK